ISPYAGFSLISCDSERFHPGSRLGLGLQMTEVGEPVASLLLVIVGEQAVGLGVSRLLAEDLLGPAQTLLGMPMLEEPAGSIILMVQVARGSQHLIQELLDVFAFRAKLGGRVLLGLGKGGAPQAGEHQAPLVMDLRLAAINAHGLVEVAETRLEPAVADFKLPALYQGTDIARVQFHGALKVADGTFLVAAFHGDDPQAVIGG